MNRPRRPCRQGLSLLFLCTQGGHRAAPDRAPSNVDLVIGHIGDEDLENAVIIQPQQVRSPLGAEAVALATSVADCDLHCGPFLVDVIVFRARACHFAVSKSSRIRIPVLF
jgi:hypothetical protein